MGAELQSQNRVDVLMLWKNFWSKSLAYKSTLEKQYFIDSEPKGEVISSKIDRLAAIFISKFKWAVKDFDKTFVKNKTSYRNGGVDFC